MKSCAHYIALAKEALGDPRMSDRELGEKLGGFLQQNISRSKAGYMPDTIADAVGKLLKEQGLVWHPGEVLLVARAEREKDEGIKETMLSYAKKVLALASMKAALAAVALGLLLSPAEQARAWQVGGVGRFRRRAL